MKKLLLSLIVLTLSINIAYAQVSQTEFEALVAFYNATNGDNWTNKTGWDINATAADVTSSWYGLTVSGGYVTEIDLSANNLEGDIPPEIGSLINLTYLFLHENQLSGNIPIQIGNLNNLTRLYLHVNQLSGSIPAELSNLTNLQYLVFRSNQLSGSIPTGFNQLVNLTYLGLHFNNFNQLVNLSNLTNLSYLYLEYNQFDFEDLETANINWAAITYTDYSPQKNFMLNRTEVSNQITFSVPFYSANNIYQWYNYNEPIIGATSDELIISDSETGFYSCRVTNSSFTDLVLNSEGEEVGGAFTQGVATADYNALISLYNSTNGENWTNNTNWTTLEPVSNWFGITVMDNRVTTIDLHQNNLIGYILIEIGNLTLLEFLRLGHNQLLTGVVPSSFSNLVNLTVLDISDNQLNQMCDLSSLINLASLRINDNNFDFGDLETTNVDWSNISSTSYSTQNDIPVVRTEESGQVTFTISADGTNNQYKWYKNDEEISGQTSNVLTINDTETGYYYCEITDTNFPLLILNTEIEDIGGTLTQGVVTSEYDALVALYNVTKGDDWTDNANWLSNSDVDSWYGVVVHNAHVTGIYLRNNSLSGIIPLAIGSFSYLSWLELNGNQLSGSIPMEIGNLSNLNTLILSYNNLSGSVPSELSNITNLEALSIQYNKFDQLSDLSSLSNLSYLSIGNNDFDFGDLETANVNWSNIINHSYSPQNEITVGRLENAGQTTLTVNIDGTNNHYQWCRDDIEIVGENGNSIIVNDTEIGIYHCEITDTNFPELILRTIAEDIGGGITQGVYTSHYNALIALYNATDGDNWVENTNWLSSEPVSYWFGATVFDNKVAEIDLNTNQLNGTIPSGIGDLRSLTNLVLHSNQLSGTIPTEIGNLTSLTELHFYNNQLTGSIPVEIGNLTALTYLNLSLNQLTGPIPAEIGNLTSIDLILLSRNQLSSSIPAQIGNLNTITGLYLYSNQLTGSIPAEIGNLSSLQRLYLYDNQLSGSIPAELGFLVSLSHLYLGNNLLDGILPTSIGVLGNLRYLDLRDNKLEGLCDLSGLINPTMVYILRNKFDFGDLEVANLNWLAIQIRSYSPQENILVTRTENAGQISLTINIDGTNNQYQWNKDGVEITGATNNSLTVNDTETGAYYCTITDSNFPQLTLYTFAEEIGDAGITNGVIDGEYDALVALFNSTGGSNWKSSSNWLSSEPVGSWYGVEVIGTHVNLLSLDANNLNGTIPIETGNLSNVTVLNLSDNNLTGVIPNEIGNMSSLLSCSLNDNTLNGNVPVSIGNLTNLEGVYLYNNELTGDFPEEVINASNLYSIIIYNNNFVKFPDVSSLSNLSYLRIYDNLLTFEHIEANIGIGNFNYSPQAKVGSLEERTVNLGVTEVLSVTVGGSNNIYQWYKDEVVIVDANSSTYTINNYSTNDAGVYYCQISNSVATELVLESETITLNTNGNYYSVRLTVTDGANLIEGATVSLTGYGNQTTDASGNAVFANVIPENSIAYTVSASGYEDGSSSIDVADADVAENVVLTETTTFYSVTFNITDGINPIESTTVSLTGYGNQTTDVSGNAVFTNVLVENNIAYIVNANGYDNRSGSVDVVDTDVTENITLLLTVYTANFNMTDGTNPIAGAIVNLIGYGDQTTDVSGIAVFANVLPENGITYTVTANDYEDGAGSINVVNADVTENVALTLSVYSVTFNVADGTNPIEGATVSLIDYDNQATDASGNAVFTNVIPENNIAYTVSVNGYEDGTGNVNVVDTDVTENVALSLIVYSVTFNVTDGTNSIEGATISLASYGNQTTDASGVAVFANVLPENSIAYTVTASGYQDGSGSIDVVNADVTENVALSPTVYSVTFNVTDGTNPIEGSIVSLTGYGNQTVDMSGNAVFANVLPENSIAYTVSSSGYEDKTGVVDVVDANATENVVLSITTSIDQLNTSVLKLYPNPSDGKFVVEVKKYQNNYNIKILNIYGKTVFSRDIKGQNKVEVDLSSLQKGTYFVKIISKKDFITRILIIN